MKLNTIGAALLLLVAASAFAAPPEVKPSPATPVSVTNTSADPIPVTGSVSVTGSITGTVTGTVGLTPGTSVMIDSTVSDPVRVRNVNDAIQPVQIANQCTSPQNTIGCDAPVAQLYKVPAGKRLVIEYASVDVCTLPGQTATLHIKTTLGANFVDHTIGVTPPAAGPGSPNIGCNLTPSSTTAVAAQVRLYADADSFVGIAGDRSSAVGTTTFAFSMSGYLVDVPLTP
jgi:hypothetical protein